MANVNQENSMADEGREISHIAEARNMMGNGDREMSSISEVTRADIPDFSRVFEDMVCQDVRGISGNMKVEHAPNSSGSSENMLVDKDGKANGDREISDMDMTAEVSLENAMISEKTKANDDLEISGISEDKMDVDSRENSSETVALTAQEGQEILRVSDNSEDMMTNCGFGNSSDPDHGAGDSREIVIISEEQEEIDDDRDSGTDEESDHDSNEESDDDGDVSDNVMNDVAVPGAVQESDEDDVDIFEGLLEDIGPELLNILVPDVFFKLFSSGGDSPAVESSHAEEGAVSVAPTDENGFKQFAGIFHLTLVSLDQWLYETPKGRAILETIVQEFPGLKNPLEEGLRNLIKTLVHPIGQLRDGTHPYYQEIERWFADHQILLKAALNFLHGAVMTLMSSYVCRGVSRLDVPRIVTEIAGTIHSHLNTSMEKMFSTPEGLRFFRANLRLIPAAMRPDESSLRNMMRMWMLPLGQLKNRANPMVKQIDNWVATSHVLVKLALEVCHGGILGLMSNKPCKTPRTHGANQILQEITTFVQGTCELFSQWLFETPKGTALFRMCLLETFANFWPGEQHYRNLVNMWGQLIIMSKNSPNPRDHRQFERIERLLSNDRDLLAMYVKSFHATLIWSINTGTNKEFVHFYIDVLRILHEINEKSGYPVSRRLFWIQGLERNLHLGLDLLRYVENTSGTSDNKTFTWLDVPFLLNVRTKWKFLSLEAVRVMKRDILKADKENKIRRKVNDTIFASWYPQARVPIIPTSVQFHIDRANIVQSAIQNVEKYWQNSDQPNPVWLKPLEINFEGESAYDFGGPSKDFFQHLFPALLETDIPIFRRLDDQIVCSDVWFNPDYLDYSTLEKIGLLFALLIFNGAIATIPFPELLYEKLLSNRDPVHTDLETIDKAFVKQLYKLREMTPEDLEALYLDFEGLETGDVDDGVTKENLEEYITETMRRRLAIPQLNAFTKGFNKLAAMTPMLREIFLAEDLRDVIVGEELDWTAFRRSARYMIPYSEHHRVIKMFWKVFGELEERDKRRFLRFLTGADHVPLGGFVPFPVRMLNHRAEKYRSPIDPDKFPEPGELMPEVMTCKGFLSMDLPEYETEEDLRFRLMLALQTDGFHREAPHHVSDTAPAINSPILQHVVRTSIQLAFGGMR